MAEGGVDLNINTECDDQRQHEKRHGYGSRALHGAKSVFGGLHRGLKYGKGVVEKMIVNHLKSRGKTLPTFDFSADYKPDFKSTCEAVDARLHNMNITYRVFNQHELRQLSETARQLRQNQIFISFVGRLNVGKSTLLNALLGARILPMEKAPETSIMVHVHHDAEDSCPTPTAASDPVHNGTSGVQKENFDPAPLAASAQRPKLILEKGKQGRSEEVVGVTEIYEKLQTLNMEVRGSAEGHKEVYCTLKMNVPLLASTPPNWRVSLVDTPGTGEYNSRVAVAAEGALKSSSVYVFITTYGEITSTENANFIKFLHAHDREVFEDRRLIVVVTQFDQAIEPDETGKVTTEEEVQQSVCQSVREACPEVEISCDDVIPLCGMWAYHARMLATDKPRYQNHRVKVERYLSCCQSFPCGQGESQPSSCLTGQSDNELATKLMGISRFDSLETRIQDLTRSCIQVWVPKMKADYERYLNQAKDELWKQMSSVYEQDVIPKEKVKKKAEEYLETMAGQRRKLEETMESTSEIYGDLEQKYPADLEDSKPVQLGKQLLEKELEEFMKTCNNNVECGKKEFGPQDLESDLKEFLERMSEELQDIFDSTCKFTQLQSTVLHHTTKMGKSIEKMRENARLLCTTLQLSPVGAETEAGKEEVSRATPSLRSIKEKVEIPGIWKRIKSGSKEKTTDCENPIAQSGDKDGSGEVEPDLSGASATPSKPPSYRSWNKQLESTMGVLQRHFDDECCNYFTTIKEKILKYFHDQYCCQTKAELQAFDKDFKTKIDEAQVELKKLTKEIRDSTLKINEQVQLYNHLLYLKDHLRDRANDYVKH